MAERIEQKLATLDQRDALVSKFFSPEPGEIRADQKHRFLDAFKAESDPAEFDENDPLARFTQQDYKLKVIGCPPIHVRHAFYYSPFDKPRRPPTATRSDSKRPRSRPGTAMAVSRAGSAASRRPGTAQSQKSTKSTKRPGTAQRSGTAEGTASDGRHSPTFVTAGSSAFLADPLATSYIPRELRKPEEIAAVEILEPDEDSLVASHEIRRKDWLKASSAWETLLYGAPHSVSSAPRTPDRDSQGPRARSRSSVSPEAPGVDEDAVIASPSTNAYQKKLSRAVRMHTGSRADNDAEVARRARGVEHSVRQRLDLAERRESPLAHEELFSNSVHTQVKREAAMRAQKQWKGAAVKRRARALSISGASSEEPAGEGDADGQGAHAARKMNIFNVVVLAQPKVIDKVLAASQDIPTTAQLAQRSFDDSGDLPPSPRGPSVVMELLTATRQVRTRPEGEAVAEHPCVVYVQPPLAADSMGARHDEGIETRAAMYRPSYYALGVVLHCKQPLAHMTFVLRATDTTRNRHLTRENLKVNEEGRLLLGGAEDTLQPTRDFSWITAPAQLYQRRVLVEVFEQTAPELTLLDHAVVFYGSRPAGEGKAVGLVERLAHGSHPHATHSDKSDGFSHLTSSEAAELLRSRRKSIAPTHSLAPLQAAHASNHPHATLGHSPSSHTASHASIGSHSTSTLGPVITRRPSVVATPEPPRRGSSKSSDTPVSSLRSQVRAAPSLPGPGILDHRRPSTTPVLLREKDLSTLKGIRPRPPTIRE